MRKIILTSISAFALLLLASCSTDNMPSEGNGSGKESLNVTINKTNSNGENASIEVAVDTVKTDIKVINSASKTLENGDVGQLKDKKK